MCGVAWKKADTYKKRKLFRLDFTKNIWILGIMSTLVICYLSSKLDWILFQYYCGTVILKEIKLVFQIFNAFQRSIVLRYFYCLNLFRNGFGLILCYILFIIFASAANLASIASSIIVGKDWIVVIAGPNTNKLSSKFISCF